MGFIFNMLAALIVGIVAIGLDKWFNGSIKDLIIVSIAFLAFIYFDISSQIDELKEKKMK